MFFLVSPAAVVLGAVMTTHMPVTVSIDCEAVMDINGTSLIAKLVIHADGKVFELPRSVLSEREAQEIEETYDDEHNLRGEAPPNVDREGVVAFYRSLLVRP